jgi:hypothetical protein
MKRNPYVSLPCSQALNREIVRAGALIDQLKANNEKARELFHLLTNLLTVRFLLLDAIRQNSRKARRIRLGLKCTRPTTSAMRRKHTRRHLTVFQALAILEAATLNCRATNINTPAIRAAFSILEPHIQPKWLIPQFGRHLQTVAELEKEADERALRATFFQIRAAVAQWIRTKRDSLALKFHYTRNPMIKQEIDHLGRELAKLDTPLDFSKK